MKYEILNGSEVINTIVATPEFMQAQYPQGNYRELPEEPETVIPEKRHITVGALYDRFGVEKYNILASTDPIVQALVKDASVRKFIDLDRDDLLMGLQMVQSKGFNIDPQAIVSSPVLDSEKP